mmetsp:Transcript_121103/g.302214  ORF Transcript_121103/g.302214 Transcript_121103/m.302214 type:complete len:115 (-) Transcript_121103:165-509(-)
MLAGGLAHACGRSILKIGGSRRRGRRRRLGGGGGGKSPQQSSAQEHPLVTCLDSLVTGSQENWHAMDDSSDDEELPTAPMIGGGGGKPGPISCASCGAEMAAGHRFCAFCGASR